MYFEDKFFDFCTDRQREYLEAINECGSLTQAANKMGVVRQVVQAAAKSVKRKAAKAGYSPDAGVNLPQDDPYYVKGVSSFINKETGQITRQWVKTDIDKEKQHDMFLQSIETMCKELPKVDKIDPPEIIEADLMQIYPVGDHHFGMLARANEAGGDFDLDKAEKLLLGAMDYHIDKAPDAGTGLIVLLGDFLHYDSWTPKTPTSGHELDADGRAYEMVDVAIRSIRYMIEIALKKHGKVHLIIEIGNHDLYSSIFLAQCVSHIYENDPRFTVDTSPSHYHYYRFGKCLIGSHHGHGKKMEKLPAVMAVDRREDWGQVEHCWWFTGHVHHEQVKEYDGCKVMSFGILPPTDAYAHNKGYRSISEMKSFTFHREHGKVTEFVVNPKMLGF